MGRLENPTIRKSFERLQNKPFWIWSSEEDRKQYFLTNGDCCFNNIIGLPENHSSLTHRF